jgi:hypothetical protein
VLLSVLLVLLFLLLLGVSAAVLVLTSGSGSPAKKDLPKDITWVRSIYGWGKTQETSLRAPSDVDFAADGSIWAVSGTNAIVGFTADGSLRKLIKPKIGNGPGQANTIEGIEIGPDGTIYVSDEGKNKVMEFKQDGTFLGEWI